MTWEIRIDEFRYDEDGDNLLENLQFSIVPGKIHHICGPSGSGKSTLMGILSGHIPMPASRAILKAEVKDFPKDKALRSTQDPYLQIASPTVIDDLLLAPEYKESSAEDALNKAIETAKRFRIESIIDCDTSILSFGEARMLGLASLCQYHAPVYLFDEPFVGLDEEHFRQFEKSILQIADSGSAIILANTRVVKAGLTIELKPCPKKILNESPEFNVFSVEKSLTAKNLNWTGWRGKAFPSFQVNPGNIITLTGANGSGKSQLLQTIAGMKDFLSGRIDRPGLCRYVPQNADLEIFSSNVVDEIMVGAENRIEEGKALLDFLGLSAFSTKSPLLMSYGQKKRVSVISAIMSRPACLLLDEPLEGLDCVNRSRLIILLKYFAKCGGIVVVATHEPESFDSSATARLHLSPGKSYGDYSFEGISRKNA